MAIITVDDPLRDVLTKKTEEIREDELSLARDISDRLFSSLEPYFPSAGLAAPQIGISKSVFIFSFDRDPSHLETVINPRFAPVGDCKIEGWEGCLSVILSSWKIAKVPRFEVIGVTYLNLKGQKVEKVLEGFAAKVFQHEYDHLQGIVNINREDALVKIFATKEEMMNFLQQVKKEDAANYKDPPISQ